MQGWVDLVGLVTYQDGILARWLSKNAWIICYLLQAQRAYIAFTLGLQRGFLVIIPPNLNETCNINESMVCTHRKKIQPLILHRFWSFLTDMNRYVRAYTSENFLNVCTAGFPGSNYGRRENFWKVGFKAWLHTKLVCRFCGDMLRDDWDPLSRNSGPK